MERAGRDGGGREADRCERPGRNCRRTDPVRVQTRADTSQKSQTKHGRIIRAIIQPRSRSARCVSLCPFCLEGQQPTLSFSPKLNSLNMLLLSFFSNGMAAAQSLISSDGSRAAVQREIQRIKTKRRREKKTASLFWLDLHDATQSVQ